MNECMIGSATFEYEAGLSKVVSNDTWVLKWLTLSIKLVSKVLVWLTLNIKLVSKVVLNFLEWLALNIKLVLNVVSKVLVWLTLN